VMNNSTDRGPTNADLIALAEAVREAARPDPPRSVETESTWICFELTRELFDQLTEWRIRAARQLSWEDLTDVEVLPVLVRMLLSDEKLAARITAILREEGPLSDD
jgi:hypothetical protein